MKISHWIAALSLVLAFCASDGSAQLASTPVTRPLAMDRLQKPASDLFALTPSQVIALHDDGQKLSPVGSFTLPATESPSDLVVGLINGQVSILVSGSNPVSGGFVTLYTSAGKQLNSWSSAHRACGMDYDGGHTIFFASCDTNEIYQANLQVGTQTTFVGEVAGAHHLGPLIVDNARGRLLVGEVDNGEVYDMDMKSHHSRLFAQGLGTPQAFTFSSSQQQLLVADSSRRKIYRLDLTATSPPPVEFGVSPQFQEPDGVALLAGGRVAVADDRANAIFVLPAH